MVYATGEDFLQRYDARLIGDLVRDDATQEPASSLPTNATLLALLADGASDIEAALFVGNRYTIAQLANLSTSAANFLRRLNCDITLLLVKRRRGKFDPQKDGELQKNVDATLASLRNGDNLLMQATDSEAQASTIELDAPQMIPILRRQTIRNRTNNYYPVTPIARWPNK